MFAISTNEENYHGNYDTVADAVEEATNGYAYETFWVGKCVPPPRPEDMWCAEDWLEHVSVQDSYSGEWAEDWDGSTRVQRNELEQEVRSVLAAWLDRHNLRPRFYTIEDPVKYRVEDGVAHIATKKQQRSEI